MKIKLAIVELLNVIACVSFLMYAYEHSYGVWFSMFIFLIIDGGAYAICEILKEEAKND